MLVGDELRRPHLMLADPGDIQRLRTGDLPDPFDGVLGSDRTVRRPVITQRVGPAPAVELAPPAGDVRPRLRLQRGDEIDDHFPAVADDRHVRDPVLPDFGRIDICMDDRGLRREGGELPGHPVIKTGTQGDQEIRLL